MTDAVQHRAEVPHQKAAAIRQHAAKALVPVLPAPAEEALPEVQIQAVPLLSIVLPLAAHHQAGVHQEGKIKWCEKS